MRNDWYLVDYDGKAHAVGSLASRIVNRFRLRWATAGELGRDHRVPPDRWHFTGKDIYRQKAFELFEKNGYLDNIMIPISQIGPRARDRSDDGMEPFRR